VPSHEEDWPALAEIVAFRDAVRCRLRSVYDRISADKASVTRHIARAVFMAYEHEAMHAETLLYMLLQSPMTLPPATVPNWATLSVRWSAERAAAEAAGANTGRIAVLASTVVMGHDDAEANDDQPTDPAHEFGWDNEHPQIAVAVGSFVAEALPVTNAEYLDFLQGTSAPAPASWVKVDDEYFVRSLFGPVSFEHAGTWPLMASQDELTIFAASKGGRLPTEAELRALWQHPGSPRPAGKGANVGFKNWHPVPPTPTTKDESGNIVPGHNGGVWEWTSTPFEGYPGFVPSELYPGYSADFFDGKHSVVVSTLL
jgi:formylglycine-generating enzyme required for sulfatase activity